MCYWRPNQRLSQMTGTFKIVSIYFDCIIQHLIHSIWQHLLLLSGIYACLHTFHFPSTWGESECWEGWAKMQASIPAPAEPEEYRGLVYYDGVDSLGRPVVIVNADALPRSASRKAAVTYLLQRLEPIVTQVICNWSYWEKNGLRSSIFVHTSLRQSSMTRHGYRYVLRVWQEANGNYDVPLVIFGIHIFCLHLDWLHTFLFWPRVVVHAGTICGYLLKYWRKI